MALKGASNLKGELNLLVAHTHVLLIESLTAHRIHDIWVCGIVSTLPSRYHLLIHTFPSSSPSNSASSRSSHVRSLYHQGSSLDDLKTFSSRFGFNDFWLMKESRTASIDAKLSPISTGTISHWTGKPRHVQKL